MAKMKTGTKTDGGLDWSPTKNGPNDSNKPTDASGSSSDGTEQDE